MGMYNMLLGSVPEKCPQCGRSVVRYIQFHYGAKTLREYRVGELIAWGGVSQEGTPGRRHVAVQGLNIGCPNCSFDDDQEFRIDIKDDVIVSVRPDDGEIDYLAQDHYYWVVLEE